MITERYIKMCEKAEEIQREWKPQTGDWAIDVWHRNPVVVAIVELSGRLLVSQIGGSLYENEQDKFFWLPTQEQLQGMVEDEILRGSLGLDYRGPCKRHIDLFWAFRFWFEKRAGEGYIRTCTSMNELWLAFVMWEKYGKVWDDKKEEWVKGECNGYRH